MNKLDFPKLAEIRIREAEVLLKAGELDVRLLLGRVRRRVCDQIVHHHDAAEFGFLARKEVFGKMLATRFESTHGTRWSQRQDHGGLLGGA